MHCSLFPRPATRCDPSRVTPTQHAFQAHSTSNPRHNVFFAIRHSAYRTPSTVDFRSLSEEGIAFVHVTDRRSLCTKFPYTVAFSWHPPRSATVCLLMMECLQERSHCCVKSLSCATAVPFGSSEAGWL